jgi:hypothetical protein
LCFSTGLWTTILSSVFIEAFISSCIFAPVIVTDNGMPFWSTIIHVAWFQIYLPLSVGFGPTCHLSPKCAFTDMLSSDCHVHLMPLRSSYSFSSLTHNFWNTFDNTHSWNRLWQVVEPEPYSFGSIFHWHPVIRT